MRAARRLFNTIEFLARIRPAFTEARREATERMFNQPVLFQDIYLHDPTVRWQSIIGLDSAKRTIKEAVVYPIRVRTPRSLSNQDRSHCSLH